MYSVILAANTVSIHAVHPPIELLPICNIEHMPLPKRKAAVLATMDQICASRLGALDLRDASFHLAEIFAEAYRLHGEDWQSYAKFVNEKLSSLPQFQQDEISFALQVILDFAAQPQKLRQLN